MYYFVIIWEKSTHASVLPPDARGGGVLRVCASDAGVSSEGTVQTQHGRAGTLHLPVWVSVTGKRKAPLLYILDPQFKFCPQGGSKSFTQMRGTAALFTLLKSVNSLYPRSNFQNWTSISDLRVSTRRCTPRRGSSPCSSPSSLCP